MFQNKTIMSIFPTNLWAHDVAPEVSGPLNEKLIARVDELLTPRPAIGPGESWQTRNDMQDDPAFADFIGLVEAAVAGVVEFLEVEPLPMEVTGCWANVNPPGSPHSLHNHPNNYLSGVYFLKTQPGAATITFFDPRDRIYMMQPPVKRSTQNNSSSIHVEAKQDRLIVFPAWLKHAVAPNESGEERISVSFNMMFSDFTKAVSKPLWTGLS